MGKLVTVVIIGRIDDDIALYRQKNETSMERDFPNERVANSHIMPLAFAKIFRESLRDSWATIEFAILSFGQ
jgi:hypothetical protein